MKNCNLLKKMASDLGLDAPFVKGSVRSVRNCWHFSTDGNAVDVMFYDDTDFRNGMNRIFIVVDAYDVVILAFSLMDTHIHFILSIWGVRCVRQVHA